MGMILKIAFINPENMIYCKYYFLKIHRILKSFKIFDAKMNWQAPKMIKAKDFQIDFTLLLVNPHEMFIFISNLTL